MINSIAGTGLFIYALYVLFTEQDVEKATLIAVFANTNFIVSGIFK